MLCWRIFLSHVAAYLATPLQFFVHAAEKKIPILFRNSNESMIELTISFFVYAPQREFRVGFIIKVNCQYAHIPLHFNRTACT